MLYYIRQVAEWGVRSDTSPGMAHHYRLTNVLLLFMFFASIGVTLLCLFDGAVQAAALNSSAPLVFALGLGLMRSGHTMVARLAVISLCTLGGYPFVAAVGPDTYLQFIFLFGSAFSFAFFSTSEKLALSFGMITPLTSFAFLELTHYRPVLGFERIEFSPGHLVVMRIVSVLLLWSLIFFHFLYFMRDRRRSQEQLVASAKMVAMARMAAGIAHEVNNPLQVIVSHAERMKSLARAGSDGREQILANCDQIQSVAMRIATINKGLLALSRDSKSDPALDVPVQSIVKLSLDLCRAHLESHKVELRLCEIAPVLTVTGRETQLSEVLLNVLNNAFDAVVDRPQKWIQIDVRAEKSWVEIAITDSGEGVSASVANKIFDPFFTTKPLGKGTGLGLSVSQAIMAAHNGKISCDTKSTAGGRFVIRIPRGPDLMIAGA